MVFLHAMGGVFRDPSFAPLLNTLDQQFGAGGTVPLSMTQHPGAAEPESGMGMRQSTSSPPPIHSQDDVACEERTTTPVSQSPSEKHVQDMTDDVSEDIEKQLLK